MTSTKLFSLEGLGLRLDSASDIAPYLTPLISNPSVEEIRLNGNTLGAPACAHLASILRTKHTLRVANLADIFTSRLLSEIPPALSSLLTALLALPRLQSVDLSDNAFGLNTVGPLVEFLGRHAPLRVLGLNNNGLGPRAGGLVAGALEALAGWKEEDNTFTVTGARALAEVVGGWSELRELGLGDCYLGARGGVLVAEALGKGQNKGLEVLRLQYNEFDAKSVKAFLVAAERGLEGLRRVELNGNKFSEDDEGVEGLRVLLDERKVEGEEGGLDELSDLEEESDEGEDEEEEDDEEDEEGTREQKAEGILKQADQEESANVSQKKDEDVDDLAAQLDKTEL
ncbi:Ran GTPase-activating protein [Lasallia pustulata]|uniref:Ran GTPase-activating protein n=1 Tax=Lasallia pustulata TaxID=136370 RepID=A0A1W5D3S4_9LECA|nr:Ran GTPase-activating protein [Lasallia pustulata]